MSLLNIQVELKVPKGNFNSFGKYKYRSAENILEAVKPLLLKYNALLTITDDIVMVGNKFFVKSTARFYCGDFKIRVCGFAEITEHKGMSAEQTTGTASSYAKKYALNNLFSLDESESDPDSLNDKKSDKKSSEISEKTIDVSIGKMLSCSSFQMLKDLYLSFPDNIRNHELIIAEKNKLKANFEKQENNSNK